MSDTDKFLIGTVLLSLLVPELRELPDALKRSKTEPDADVRGAITFRWVAILALAVAVWWYANSRSQGA